MLSENRTYSVRAVALDFLARMAASLVWVQAKLVAFSWMVRGKGR
jgi:hypothetical protein